MLHYICECLFAGAATIMLLLAVAGLSAFIITYFPKIVVGSVVVLFVFGVGALVKYLFNWWDTDHHW